MRYHVYNRAKDCYEHEAIVTQEGDVAFWDESSGWSSEFCDQADYLIGVIESSLKDGQVG